MQQSNGLGIPDTVRERGADLALGATYYGVNINNMTRSDLICALADMGARCTALLGELHRMQARVEAADAIARENLHNSADCRAFHNLLKEFA